MILSADTVNFDPSAPHFLSTIGRNSHSRPRITSAELIKDLGQRVLQRIDEVNYEISVEGLGYPQSSPQYESVLHGIPNIGERHDPA